MYIETALDKQINKDLRAANEAESAAHISSGGLSASGLMEPLQWQVLKSLVIGSREIEDYTLRKFIRGRQVEDWLMVHIPGLISTQERVEYRGVVGLMDAFVDTKDYDHNLGQIPHEVKSVTNAKFKRINKLKEADIGHKYQSGLYALAKGSTHYAIDYIAADDLRVLSFVFDVAEVKPEIDAIIDAYDAQMVKQIVPIFEPRIKWQADTLYQKFPDWATLTEKECTLALNYLYPEAWQKYKERKEKK